MTSESLWAAAALALLLVGVAPGLLLCARGTAVSRLIGLELLGASAIMAMVALSAAVNQSSYLIVPLVLAVLTATGTLVYTRLLTPESTAAGDAGPGNAGAGEGP
ncbi:monovalent cation/H+ antiporter complex subunit F [Sinomonas atrocyanea]|uniref:monovalent cation/H+ antiporter complex subunit F n=1 Tax=Sinomonas atrocyanea TaxID=37927 RepID=UPI00278095DE|nr:monovalent cation/H+ antiporter complex subunit F [Sinomonas atrocyanea]MDQ0260972.1 multisubunit Na+/H+ antiporter MnhF subunit [Sinomonas atrocyanea]MDR6622073.1 multisubunit Na+/H+ antiporter MnhF subunit [Sinomonas atrocyanea]